MLQALGFVLLGLGALYAGAEAFVGGAASLARGLRIGAAVIGLTVVSFASSTPELVVSTSAALAGAPDIALGNILGSNVANIGLVLGISAVVHAILVTRETLTGALSFVLYTFLLLYLLSLDGAVGRLDGCLLLLLALAYLWRQLRAAIRQQSASAPEHAPPLRPVRDPLLIALGLAGMVAGGYLLVEGATTIATALGVSELFIAVSVVALGTSLPELAASTVAAWRGHPEIAVGNVIGSNIMNVGFVLALVAIIRPVQVHPEALRQYPYVLGFTLALFPILRPGRRISRVVGLGLLAAYGIYLWVSYGVR